MKILITGIKGYFGQILSHILEESHSVYGLGREHTDYNLDLSLGIPNNFIDFDIVVHAAAKAHITPRTEAENEAFFNVNVKGTKNLLKGLEQAPTLPQSFVFISSVAAYGLEHGTDIDENYPLKANDPYGLSKIQAEQVVEEWCKKHNVICSILRLPLLVGTNPPGNLGVMINGIKRGYYFNISGGKAKKSMVIAEDVARIIPKVATIGGVYNLTDGYHPTFKELSQHIAKQFGRKENLNMPYWIAKLLAIFGDMAVSFPVNSKKITKITSDLTFNDTKARKLLGWNPQKVVDNFQIELRNYRSQ
ncbi:NAD-dependent epimerase/dehydratase family protein [Pedobacter montanisoli]|uniref:NAD-dependent epimerase/dehydratase family protein n=1 Tax=Pedobacter montanisoli TaxID=2923277 RepID=A0ABS9ZSC3_9SPHI|nr:NAD-dependent epimerase/dehydratase family protein [Pedobacter montanisoli]MCJ0741491.1 NAD-dependent epimerase/dehydratase family protein [Pedobacter montanisoli]